MIDEQLAHVPVVDAPGHDERTGVESIAIIDVHSVVQDYLSCCLATLTCGFHQRIENRTDVMV